MKEEEVWVTERERELKLSRTVESRGPGTNADFKEGWKGLNIRPRYAVV